jgi:hypothetical protein
MGYHIYAWLEEGNPNLEIVDAESRDVCVKWSYSETAGAANDSGVQYDKKEIQKLFQQLLLLTCKQELSNCRVFSGMEFGRSIIEASTVRFRPNE